MPCSRKSGLDWATCEAAENPLVVVAIAVLAAVGIRAVSVLTAPEDLNDAEYSRLVDAEIEKTRNPVQAAWMRGRFHSERRLTETPLGMRHPRSAVAATVEFLRRESHTATGESFEAAVHEAAGRAGVKVTPTMLMTPGAPQHWFAHAMHAIDEARMAMAEQT